MGSIFPWAPVSTLAFNDAFACVCREAFTVALGFGSRWMPTSANTSSAPAFKFWWLTLATVIDSKVRVSNWVIEGSHSTFSIGSIWLRLPFDRHGWACCIGNRFSLLLDISLICSTFYHSSHTGLFVGGTFVQVIAGGTFGQVIVSIFEIDCLGFAV